MPTTVEILRSKLKTRPLDVAQILLERLTGTITYRIATLKNGEDMNVVTPEGISTQLWLTGDFEPEVTFLLESVVQRGMTLWNIGAHIGTRVVQGDGLVGNSGQILAFEPTPRTKEILDSNSSKRKSIIQTFPYAVGDQTARVSFKDYGWISSGLNTVAQRSRFQPRRWKKEPIPTIINTQMVAVDSLLASTWLKAPDVLVIDAEGYELPIFKGASETLKHYQPIVIFETGDLGESDTLGCIRHLSQLGYAFFEYHEGVLKPHQVQEKYPDPGNLVAINPTADRSTL